MSSQPINGKSRTPVLAAVALFAIVGAGAYVAYAKGVFRSDPVIEMPPMQAIPEVGMGAGLPEAQIPSVSTENAPMHPDAVGSVTPLLADALPPQEPEAPSVTSAAGLSPQLTSLMDLRRKSELGRARVEAMQIEFENQKAEERLHGASIGANDLPELVGLSGSAPRITAEFLVSNRIVQARNGDWVTRDWQLTSVQSNGVTLTRRGGRDVRSLLFGDTPGQVGNNPQAPFMQDQTPLLRVATEQ